MKKEHKPKDEEQKPHVQTQPSTCEQKPYRKFRDVVLTKCIEYGVPVIFVNPENMSCTCPRCGEKLCYIYRLVVCPRCGFIADRDRVGAMNVLFRALEVIGRGKLVYRRP